MHCNRFGVVISEYKTIEEENKLGSGERGLSDFQDLKNKDLKYLEDSFYQLACAFRYGPLFRCLAFFFSSSFSKASSWASSTSFIVFSSYLLPKNSSPVLFHACRIALLTSFLSSRNFSYSLKFLNTRMKIILMFLSTQ